MTIVKHIVIALLAAGFTFAMIVVGAIAWDMLHHDNVPSVAISEMLAEAAAGHVEEITVRGARYEYRLRGANVTKVAYGPKTTSAELAPFAGGAKLDVQ